MDKEKITFNFRFAAGQTRAVHFQKCPIPKRQRAICLKVKAAKEEIKIAVIDFETDPFEHGEQPCAFACGFSTGDVTETKWGSEPQVVKWAIEKVKKFKGIVYAHNGGKFDFPGYIFRYAGE